MSSRQSRQVSINPETIIVEAAAEDPVSSRREIRSPCICYAYKIHQRLYFICSIYLWKWRFAFHSLYTRAHTHTHTHTHTHMCIIKALRNDNAHWSAQFDLSKERKKTTVCALSRRYVRLWLFWILHNLLVRSTNLLAWLKISIFL